jgi:outer membrane protein
MSQEQIKSIDAELKTIQDEVTMLQQNLYEYREGIQQQLLLKQQELFKPLREKINRQIEAVAKEMKYQFVFDKAADAMLYGDKTHEITYKVLDKLK